MLKRGFLLFTALMSCSLIFPMKKNENNKKYCSYKQEQELVHKTLCTLKNFIILNEISQEKTMSKSKEGSDLTWRGPFKCPQCNNKKPKNDQSSNPIQFICHHILWTHCQKDKTFLSQTTLVDTFFFLLRRVSLITVILLRKQLNDKPSCPLCQSKAEDYKKIISHINAKHFPNSLVHLKQTLPNDILAIHKQKTAEEIMNDVKKIFELDDANCPIEGLKLKSLKINEKYFNAPKK